MPVSMERLLLGEAYDRPFLAQLWGYRDWHAIGRGVVTPAKDNKIILFVTGAKQPALRQYEDHFDGDTLHMEGEGNHANDERIITSERRGNEVHLFFRERHHMPFTYIGEVKLLDYQRVAGSPTRFRFATSRSEAVATSTLRTEQATHGDVDDSFFPDSEGRRLLRLHRTYERSPKNRARAIAIHGTVCSVCGFDFDQVYGPELARSYIEIHHVRSLAAYEGVVDPETDLVPLCSNCHSMAHRRYSEIVPIDELRELVSRRRA